MIGFKTNNSIYLVNQKEKQISGGAFKENIMDYDKAIVIVGLPAEIYLKDGRVVRTSTVKSCI